MEREFNEQNSSCIVCLSKYVLAIFIVITVLNLIYQIVILSHNLNEASKLIASMVIQVVSLFTFIIHFMIQRKNQTATKSFACFESMIVTLSIFEGSMIQDETFKTPEGVLLALVMVACLSTITHSQRDLLFSYLICCTYSLVRSYFWIGQANLIKYFKFNISVIIAYIMIYVFSRAVHQIQRVNFIQQKNQSLLLSVFSDLIGSFHDGLMISGKGSQILYHNTKIT